MKTITKEINLLDIADIEQAVSNHLGKKVTISEIDCSLAYCIPMGSGKASGMYLELTIGDDFCDSLDLFFDDELNGHYLDGKPLCLDEPWLAINEIFNFDVSVFKSFDSWTDSSD
ncbi:MAG: hypothetical protein E7539_05815 [Ruminococcaceae bacterium]|nr:hypothetical protein [Oscillospiraceae bacterium]